MNNSGELKKSAAATTGAFPTRLNTFERFQLYDGDDQRPNLIFCRLTFDRSIDEATADKALQIVRNRQPMFNVVVKNERWVVASEQTRKQGEGNFFAQTLDAPPDAWGLPHPANPMIDPGPIMHMRSWNSNDNGSQSTKTEIWYWAHHVIFDGAAAVLFINNWLRAYSNLINNREPLAGIPRIDPSLVSDRSKIGLTKWKYLKYIPFQCVGLFGAAKFVFRKIAMPAQDNNSQRRAEVKSGSRYPALVSTTLSVEATKTLAEFAEQIEVRTNSVLMACMFRAIANWRRAQVTESEKTDLDWIRILLPINIRDFSDRRLPAVNRTSIVQIDRRKLNSTEREDLSRSIDREVGVIRNWQLDKMFLIMLRGLSLIPTQLKRAATNKKSRGYAVFTNLGNPFRAIEKTNRRANSESIVEPATIDFLGPVRSGTPFNIAFALYRDALRLSLHYDSEIINREQATQLLDLLTEEVGALGNAKG